MLIVATGLVEARAVPALAPEPQLLLLAGLADVLLLLILVGAIGAAAVLAFRAWAEGRYGHDAGEDGLPPLVFPSMQPPAGAVRPRPSVPQEPATRSRPAARRPAAPHTEASSRRSAAIHSEPAPHREPAPQPAARSAPPRSAKLKPAGNGAAIREDVTLQILPGRLEVLGGDAGQEEIRFVRGPGHEASITLGRSSGSAPEHVQLRSPAVSRLHARMRFADGRWYVSNLSQTNPAVVNGEVLDDSSGERLLQDGDQLELGDVVLRFRT